MIVIENKEKDAGSKCTKYIKLRYFFMKDKIVQKEIDVKYCLTENVVRHSDHTTTRTIVSRDESRYEELPRQI